METEKITVELSPAQADALSNLYLSLFVSFEDDKRYQLGQALRAVHEQWMAE